MEPHPPWIEVPDDWLDGVYDHDPEYQRIQRYFRKPVKCCIIDEFLLGEGNNHRGETMGVKSLKSEIDAAGRLQISGIMTCQAYDKNGKIVMGGGEIKRSFNRQSGEVNFIRMLPDDYKTKPFPKGFSYLYYRKSIPLLRSHTVDWHGIIPDINNENTIEMEELIETLTPPRHIP